MKTSTPLIGKILLVFVFIAAMQSCIKSTDIENGKQSIIANNSLVSQPLVSTARENTESQVTTYEIVEWLQAQKGPEDSSENRNKFISDIISNLAFDNLIAEEWAEEEFIISIPVGGHLSMHEDENSLTYLVIFEDEEGHISRGELAIVNNYNEPIESPQVGLRDLYLNNNTGIEYNGKIKLVTFQDYEFSETTFEGGELRESESYHGERIALDGDCLHWFWVHYEFDLTTGEILDYFIVDLGCLNCPPNALCDQLTEINGEANGGGASQPAPRTRSHKIMMREFHYDGDFETFKFYENYSITGIPGNNPSQSQFISVVDYSSQYTYNNPSTGVSYGPYHANIVNSHSEDVNAYTSDPVYCTALYTMTFINQPIMNAPSPIVRTAFGFKTFLPSVI